MNLPHAGAVRRQVGGVCSMRSWVNSASSTQALFGAPRARLRNRSDVATRLRFLGLGRHGSLRGAGVFAALGKNLFDLGVRAGNDVY